jgi:hypothetical protein
MKRIHNMASALLRRGVFKPSVRKTAQRMDPTVRSALARDVAEQVGGGGEVNVQQELATIEDEIIKAKQLLQQSEAKETFLGQRSAQYRKALDERARLLRQEQDEVHARKEKLLQESEAAAIDDDEEGGNITASLQEDDEEMERRDLAKRLEQWEKGEDALTSIVETHKHILAHCEEIRRKIKELERKRADCCAMAGECRDFLDTATAAANAAADDQEQEASRASATSPSLASLQREERANDDVETTTSSQNNQGASNPVIRRHNREEIVIETIDDNEELARALDSTSAV